MSNEVQVIESAVPDALTATAIVAQVRLIQDVMEKVMIKDVHYGVIPGTGTKPSLLKPGAEKLNLTFRLDPQYDTTERFVGDHLYIRSKCTLYHITSGRRMGSGEGSCSTKESKYAYRQGTRKCPKCGKEAIIKGKAEFGGGWLCFKKKDGCGAKWPDGAKEIESQSVERVANEDLADQYNTVLKMANKRSLIAAVLNVTAASDIFTQDVEDMPQFEEKKPQEEPSSTTKTFAEKFPEQAQKIQEKLAPSAVLEPSVSEALKDMGEQDGSTIKTLHTMSSPATSNQDAAHPLPMAKTFNQILIDIDMNPDWCLLKSDWKLERKLKNLNGLTPQAQEAFLKYMREKIGKAFPY